MWRPRSLLTALLASLGLVGALFVAPVHAAEKVPVLVAVRAAHHPGFDRVVFDFDGPLPAKLRTRWADQVRADGSGTPLNLHGNAFLEVTMDGVLAHEVRGGSARLTYKNPVRAFGLTNLNQMIGSGDFEAHVTIGLGLVKRTRVLRTFTLQHPSRYVVDIGTSFRKTRARVFFVDRERVRTGEEPVVRSVLRTVPRPAVARGQLHRLYAGPTPAEKRDGLQMVTSIVPPPSTEQRDRTGFRRLRVNDGVARVQLTGRCSSGGSTITVAAELQPTLRFWPTVDHVKIYDAGGRTEQPAGHTDSIPTCLEP